MLFKVQASKLTRLLYSQNVSLSPAELVRSMLRLSAIDKKRAVSLLLAPQRRDVLTTELLKELVLAVKECFVQDQLIALWVLMAKSDQPLVSNFLAKMNMKFIKWPLLNNKIIYDRQGERYLLRVLLDNAFFPSIYIDMLDQDVDLSLERWPLDMEIDEPLKYDKNLKKNTVARFSFSFLEEHIDEVGSLERSHGDVSLKKLSLFFSNIELSRSEVLPIARGRGLYKELAKSLVLIMPRGATLSLKEIVEEDTVKKLKEGGSFYETVFGKSFNKKTFKVIFREFIPAPRFGGEESFDILLKKR